MSPKQKFRKQIHYMTCKAFADALAKEFGEGSQSRFSELSGLSRSIVSRYCGAMTRPAKGRIKTYGQWIPKDVVIMFLLIKQARRLGLPVPDPKAHQSDTAEAA